MEVDNPFIPEEPCRGIELAEAVGAALDMVEHGDPVLVRCGFMQRGTRFEQDGHGCHRAVLEGEMARTVGCNGARTHGF